MMVRDNRVVMDFCKFIAILILYCASTAVCYPTRPLNERSSPDLTWQAWLLVDDQNQNQNKQTSSGDGMLRRRITPKSVFIAPTFSPESLPPCAVGYSSDQMGRCIKIIELNNTVHEEFILELLKTKFSTDYDYDDGETENPIGGPLQVNIPLDYGDGLTNDNQNEDTDIAIIVSPTKPIFDFKKFNLGKRDSPSDEEEQEMFLKKLAETTTRKLHDSVTQMEEITTSTEEITTDKEVDTTVTSQTTLVSESDDSSIATDSYDITTTLNEPTLTTEHEVTTPDSITTDIQSTAPTTTTLASKEEGVPLKIIFPEAKRSSYVKFPDSDSFPTQIPSSIEAITSAVIRKSNDQIVFRDNPQTLADNSNLNIELPNLDYSNGAESQQRSFNRRNRDRNNGMFHMPQRWRDANLHKPLVLRFSRKHAYFDTTQFNSPDYYRSIPSDDFAYLFKFKHKQSNRR